MHFKKKFSHRVERFWMWLKKLLILGRTDWKLASDQCKPPRLTQSQRAELQPKFDVNAIRPRSVSAADVQARKSAPPPEPLPVGEEPAESAPAGAASAAAAPAAPVPAATPGRFIGSDGREYEVRRRKKRGAKHKGISPLTAFSAQESLELRGLAGKIFGKNGE